MRLSDSELKVMNIVWERGNISAKEISVILKDEIGWNKNTTYTLIDKCVKKKAIERVEPGYICKAIVEKNTIAKGFVNQFFGGRLSYLISSFVESEEIDEMEIKKIKDIIERM